MESSFLIVYFINITIMIIHIIIIMIGLITTIATQFSYYNCHSQCNTQFVQDFTNPNDQHEPKTKIKFTLYMKIYKI